MFPRCIRIMNPIGGGTFSFVFNVEFKQTDGSEKFIKGVAKVAIVSDEKHSCEMLEIDVLHSAYEFEDPEDEKIFKRLMSRKVTNIKMVTEKNILDEIHCSNILQSNSEKAVMNFCPTVGMRFVQLIRKKNFTTLTPSRYRRIEFTEEDRKSKFSPIKNLFGNNINLEEEEGEKGDEKSVDFGDTISNSSSGDFEKDFQPIVRNEPKIVSDVKKSSTNSFFHDQNSEQSLQQLQSFNHKNNKPESSTSTSPTTPTTSSEDDEEEGDDNDDDDDLTPPENRTTTFAQMTSPKTNRRIPPRTPGKGMQPPERIRLSIMIFPRMDGSLTDLILEEEEEEKKRKPKLTVPDMIRFWFEYLSTQNAISDKFIHLDPSSNNFLFRYSKKRRIINFYLSDYGLNSRTKLMRGSFSLPIVSAFKRSIRDLAKEMMMVDGNVITELNELYDQITNKIDLYSFKDDLTTDSSRDGIRIFKSYQEALTVFFKDCYEIVKIIVTERMVRNLTENGMKLIIPMVKEQSFGEVILEVMKINKK